MMLREIEMLLVYEMRSDVETRDDSASGVRVMTGQLTSTSKIRDTHEYSSITYQVCILSTYENFL